MPRDIQNIGSLRIAEQEEEEEEHIPLDRNCKSRSNPKTSNSNGRRESSPENRACYYNYGINEGIERYHESFYQFKTKSLPVTSMKQTCEDKVYSVLDLSPEDIASQLTLLDLQCYKAIRPEELTTCGWNKKNKHVVSPNVVAFTTRFNRAMFWTVHEILCEETAKMRAEVIVRYIKAAKKLHELSNYHSLFALMSALLSVSIYRLSQTWALVPKKEKLIFDKFKEIFSIGHNWANLRLVLDSTPLPCIPHLGLFQTDLIYIDLIHPVGSPDRSAKMKVIIEILQRFQNSEYKITPIPRVTEYLSSVRYIEELQKFVEDDYYKLSQKLEAPSPVPSGSSSKESIKEPGQGCSTPFTMSPSRRSTSSSFRCHNGAQPLKFHPTHRKSHSLGTKFRSASLPRNFHKVTFGGGGIFCHTKSLTEEVAENGTHMVSLLDDTVLESPGVSRISISSQPGPGSDLEVGVVTYEGGLKRKTIYKDGKKATLSAWQRYWVQLYNGCLVYFASKTFKGLSRCEYRSEPCKMVPLEGWSVCLDSENDDTFQLINHETHTIYKLKSMSEVCTAQWIAKIQEVTNKISKPMPENLLSFE